MDRRFEALETKLETRFSNIEGRFTAVDGRFTAVDERFTAVEERFTALEVVLGQRFDQLDTSLGRLTGLVFGAVVAMLAAVAGVLLQ
jgi:tetrahydromethanopterin S-methyltransferase subunit G